MMRDGSSLFVILALLFVLAVGAAWVYMRYHVAPPSDKVGCTLTENE